MLNLLPVQSNDYLALDPNEQMSYEKPKAYILKSIDPQLQIQ